MGKTFFLFYMIYRFKHLRRSIAVSSGNVDVILDREHPRLTDKLALQDYLDNHPKSIYLYDPCNKPGVGPTARTQGLTIITTSEDEANLASVKNMPKDFLYMPVWTLEELMLCSTLCYKDITRLDVVLKRFYHWGGAVRNVLRLTDVEVQKQFTS